MCGVRRLDAAFHFIFAAALAEPGPAHASLIGHWTFDGHFDDDLGRTTRPVRQAGAVYRLRPDRKFSKHVAYYRAPSLPSVLASAYNR